MAPKKNYDVEKDTYTAPKNYVSLETLQRTAYAKPKYSQYTPYTKDLASARHIPLAPQKSMLAYGFGAKADNDPYKASASEIKSYLKDAKKIKEANILRLNKSIFFDSNTAKRAPLTPRGAGYIETGIRR